MEKENPTRDFASFETFLFWFGFCAIRVLSTFGSRYIQPRSMLWANLIGLSLSSIGLFFSTSPLFSTFCIFLFGCSIATCFPTAIAFAQTKTDVTGTVQPQYYKGDLHYKLHEKLLYKLLFIIDNKETIALLQIVNFPLFNFDIL